MPNQLLATRDLAAAARRPTRAATPLPAAGRSGASRARRDPKVGDRSLSFALTVPSYGGCGQAYLPVGVEVRLASRDEVDFNQTCAQLQNASFADCFRRVSQFRVWNDGNPNSQVRIGDVYLTGGCGNTDAYFGTLPLGVDRLPLRRRTCGSTGAIATTAPEQRPGATSPSRSTAPRPRSRARW